MIGESRFGDRSYGVDFVGGNSDSRPLARYGRGFMERSDIKALTFDLFGTILDLGGSLTPYIAEFLEAKGADVSADRFWDQWRARQRIEQYQDTLVMLGHSGYLETVRRAFVYTLNLNGIQTIER